MNTVKLKSFLLLCAMATILSIFFGVRAYTGQDLVEQLHTMADEQVSFPDRMKDRGCSVEHGYPDVDCTPGAIFANVTKEDVCTHGYSKKARHVSSKEKEKIYGAYGIEHHTYGEYEVDHFISLELGGSNDAANLFPEAAEPRPGFHEKDEVENFLHSEVCRGDISLRESQSLIRNHWVEVYELLHENATTQ